VIKKNVQFKNEITMIYVHRECTGIPEEEAHGGEFREMRYHFRRDVRLASGFGKKEDNKIL